ncbi:tigger transposable element-derived 1-like [Pelobates cultripes]|uniref:Tigger transposable element-derived 1-like n=1 Tax=Pelobates cultripes TaxID=61616 RepID=A0AAD1R2R5_PELCU|nr:tigger transposable element-derived 1-like [Pelobates cultripes]
MLFVEWVNECFGPSVKQYLLDKGHPLKGYLAMDNAPAHPPDIEDDLLEEFRFIKVMFLPPNTMPFIQPMDQQGFAPEEQPVVNEIVSLGNTMGVYMDHEDIQGLVEVHDVLTTDELMYLHKEQQHVVIEELSSEDKAEESLSSPK